MTTTGWRTLGTAVFTLLAACSMTAQTDSGANAGGANDATAFDRSDWRLGQPPMQGDPAPADQRRHLLIETGNARVSGFGGCNRLFGGYQRQGATLKLDKLASTRMYCEGRMADEQAFVDQLARVERWRIVGGRLQLLDEKDQALFTLDAAPRR